jgi:hypothetical protein
MSQPDVSKPTISQQPDKRDWVPVIVGAIAALLGGGILASIFNSLISYVTAPYVQVLIKPDSKHNGSNATILMVNIGGTAAKHVKLTVKTPEEITSNDTFNTENITLQKVNPKLLQGDMKRFVQGAGSLVNISLAIKAKPNINYTQNYAAFVTYDQGSNIGGFSFKSPQYITYIIIFIVYTISAIVCIHYIRRIPSHRRTGKLTRDLKQIISESDQILQTLREEPKLTYSIRVKTERILDSLERFRRCLNYYYTDGKVHKEHYHELVETVDSLAKSLNEQIEMLDKQLKNSMNANNKNTITTPTKSVHEVTEDTSEGKPITDEK